ncbi:MAG: arsenite methyltransferase [Candidatus Hydrogenedentota bacterium]
MSSSRHDEESIRDQVRQGYTVVATGGGSSCCGPQSDCCGSAETDEASAMALALGYDAAELADLPEGANMGLSCGNPAALASLVPGETVVDLGSGGGFDVFLAGRKVGAEGRVIGVDMTPAMVSKARSNAEQYREQTGLDNVEFRLGEIEHLPVPDNSGDVVISNCVINLSPDKPQVWREIARVLKPGGRVAVSDVALRQPLPEAIRGMVEALVGCVAGASLIEDIRAMMGDAGLEDITLTPKQEFVDQVSAGGDPMWEKIRSNLPGDASAADYITSLDIAARKPR